jgi:hypothetical protein
MRLPLVVLLLGLPSASLAAQRVTWDNLVTLYGDNTEFFTPYRVGETILGGQFTSAVVVRPSPRLAVHAGVFGDVRWGSDRFLDEVKPLLSFRYTTATSTGVFGTLETRRRHGLLDPLAVSTLELTRPVEYGLQWIERRRRWHAEAFVNWQQVNTASQPEVFDAGFVVRVQVAPVFAIEAQGHQRHQGGQLDEPAFPVTNNGAFAIGLTLSHRLGSVGRGSLQLFQLASRGSGDPAPPADAPGSGHGTIVRAGLEPARGLELFGIVWRGRDFLSQEGDHNYNSTGRNPGFYRSRRKYLEIGVMRRAVLDGGVEFDLEFRLHRVDDEPSVAIGDSPWEYSYRVVARTPFHFTLKRR